jgi:hypothetical protein
MTMRATRVSSKTKLASELGISRQTLYAFCRLPDSPPARHGYYPVSEWHKYITRKRDFLNMSEKEQLQIALLRAKVEREQFDLDQARERTQKEILKKLMTQFVGIAHLIQTECYRMRIELVPRFEGLSAREISKTWDTRERQMWKTIVAELQKRTGANVEEKDTPPAVNGILFDRRRAVAG